MRDTPKKPSQEEFAKYWRWTSSGQIMIIFYGVYLGGLALFAFVVHLIAPPDGVLLFCMIAAIAYVILMPCISIAFIRKLLVRFLRCPNCGSSFGKDRHWESIVWTGRCTNCSEQVLRDFMNDKAA